MRTALDQLRVMKEKRPICVIGPGALGLFFAINLADNHAVSLLVKDSQRLVYEGNPLSIVGDMQRSLAPGALQIIDKTGLKNLPADALFLSCVKAYDLDSSVEELLPALRPSNPLILTQNGLGIFLQAAELLRRAAPIVRVLSSFGVMKRSPTQVALTGKMLLSISAQDQEPKLRDEISEIFKAGGAVIHHPKNIAYAEWEKALLNLAVNPLTSVLNERNGVVIEDKGLSSLTLKVISEVRQVAKAEGFDLSYISNAALFERIRNSANNLNNNVIDLRNDRRTEIEFLLGRFLRLAEGYNVQTPCLNTLYALCKRIESY